MNVFHACNLVQNASEYAGGGIVNGTGSIQNVFARFPGGWAARLNPAGVALGTVKCAPLGPAGFFVGNVTDSLFRTYFAYKIKAAVQNEPFMQFNATGGSPPEKMSLWLTSAGTIQIVDSQSATMATSSTVLSASQFYRIQVHCGTGNPGPWEVQIYDPTETLLETLSGTGNLNTFPCPSVDLGKVDNNHNNTVDYYFADTLWNDAVYPGRGQSGIILPVGDGFYLAGVPNGAPQRWAAVDEVPPDEDVSYVNGMGAGQAFTCVVRGGIIGTINTYKAYVRLKRDGAVNSKQSLRMRSGLVDSDTDQAGGVANYTPFQRLFDTDPATGLPWTAGGVNATQIGVAQVDGNPCRVTACYAFVDYVPAAMGIVDCCDTILPQRIDEGSTDRPRQDEGSTLSHRVDEGCSLKPKPDECR
jgi:hypothetical protein